MTEEVRRQSFNILAFFLMVIAFYGLDSDFSHHDNADTHQLYYKIGYLIVTSLIYSILLNSILKALVSKLKEYPGKWFFSFALVFSIFSLLLNPTTPEKPIQVNNADRALARILRKGLDGQESAETFSEMDYGVFSSFLKELQSASKRLEREHTEFLQVVWNTNTPQMLSLDSISEFHQLKESIRILKKLRKAADEAENKAKAIIAKMKDEIKKIEFPGKGSEAVFIGNLRKGLDQSEKTWETIYGYKRQYFQEIEKLFNFLIKNFDVYWQEDGQLYFLNEMNAQIFNSGLNRLSALENEEQMVLRSILTRSELALKDLNVEQ